jgi:hypothetical protein
LAVATLLAFIPSFPTGIAAVIIFAAVYLWQRKRAANQSTPSTVVEPAVK